MMADRDPPPEGYLLTELGYLDEIEAAAALNIEPKTLAEYRKTGVGPDYAVVARRILYSKAALAKWLEAGGSREAPVSLRRRAAS
jgi:Helix-turn-helix domain